MYYEYSITCIDAINSPADVKKLSVEEMKQLAEEMRQKNLAKGQRCRWARWSESRCSRINDCVSLCI